MAGLRETVADHDCFWVPAPCSWDTVDRIGTKDSHICLDASEFPGCWLTLCMFNPLVAVTAACLGANN